MNRDYRLVCMFCYLIFFLPLLVDKKNKLCRFHANQSLVLLIATLLAVCIGAIIPVIGWFLILPMAGITYLIIACMGMVNAYKGKMKELPIIGKTKMIKIGE